MYPITIIDNFFPDPDKVVEYGINQEFFPTTDGRWPGKRTKPLLDINPTLFKFVGEKIHNIFYENVEDWFADVRFQLIEPFSNDQYDIRNQGWIHKDNGTNFAGVIYLDKNPDNDTGTSMFRERNGYSVQHKDCNAVKEKFYMGEEVPDELYSQAFHGMNSQYVETVKVKNVYNRLVMFNNKQHHGVPTFGTKNRLTMTIFSSGVIGPPPPLYR